jgi:hypothetical protein
MLVIAMMATAAPNVILPIVVDLPHLDYVRADTIGFDWQRHPGAQARSPPLHQWKTNCPDER